MVHEDVIRKILEAGVEAPSGENAQPWRFAVRGDEIELLNVPERDRSLYNFRERASHIAHGAVIENIVIAASALGHEASVTLFPDEENPDIVARISLQASARKDDPLYPFITKRSTNRKPYDATKPIPPETIQKIAAAAASDSVQAVFVADPTHVKEIAAAASVNDRLLLENRAIHNFFFSHVHWTLAEEQKKRSGFYIEVLELLPPVKKMFKLFRHWPIMNIFNVLGAAKKGAKENTKLYSASAAMGALIISNESPATFVNVGRSLERLWLTATSEGISMQPLTGTLFFHQRIKAGEGGVFSATHRSLIESAHAKIAAALGVSTGTIAMMFRMGYADPPTAHSLKMPPEIMQQ